MDQSEPLNESAISSAWLLQRLNEAAPPGPVHRWRALAEAMRAESGAGRDPSLEIDRDPWLCRSQVIADGRVRPAWVPPDNLDDFAPGPLNADTLGHWGARPTRHAPLDALISGQPTWPREQIVVRCNRAIAIHRSVTEATTPPLTDPRLFSSIVMLNQVNAWLDVALGAPFRGLLLTPARTFEELDAQAGTTVALAETILRNRDEGDAFLERTLNGVHNMPFGSDDTSTALPTRAGQSELWRERWGWLSQECAPADARQAVVLAAQLLANIAVIAPLVHLTNNPHPSASLFAMCSLRRVMLTFRAMAWVEEALRQQWQFVRPMDIFCFAYAALRTQQPRAAVALSHRSRTVKPLLFDTPFWRSPFAAIDATYIPHWETNLAMIWGLFASAPAIVRMASVTYRESEWCQRESELIDFLASSYDFVRNRHVIDLQEAVAPKLDELLAPPVRVEVSSRRPIRSISVPELSEEESSVMSAAGAVRMIWAETARGRTDETIRAVHALRRGVVPDLQCPTNNVDGWRGYIEIFQRAVRQRPLADDAPVVVAGEWPRAATLLSPERAKYQPDFTDSRVPALRDHLAACEWTIVEEDDLLSEHGHASLIVDCRKLTRDEWEREASYTLHRGLTSAPTRVPVWFVQRAPERVDRWPAIGDYRPIFTEHLANQFTWMDMVRLPPNWFERYLTKSGLRW
jgi:hypothetical protein